MLTSADNHMKWMQNVTFGPDVEYICGPSSWWRCCREINAKSLVTLNLSWPSVLHVRVETWVYLCTHEAEEPTVAGHRVCSSSVLFCFVFLIHSSRCPSAYSWIYGLRFYIVKSLFRFFYLPASIVWVLQVTVRETKAMLNQIVFLFLTK